MNGLILSVFFLTGTAVSIREAGHEGEGVCGERGSVLTQEMQCQYSEGNSRQIRTGVLSRNGQKGQGASCLSQKAASAQ